MSEAIRYRIGVDVGDKSVGLAAIEFDDTGMPIKVLAAVSHIHDGGLDPSTAKSPRSRLATAGVARRTRRLVRNRRKRLRRLDDILIKHGFPVPQVETPQTYEAWHARAALSRGFVNDEAQSQEWISLAARHIARHRGWRNPWHSFERLSQEPTPTVKLQETLTHAYARFDRPEGTWSTLGQLASDVASREVGLRPRTANRESLQAKSAAGAVFKTQVHQADQLHELRLILTTQQVPADVISEICQVVFVQTKPHVPIGRVGTDELPGMSAHPRAPRSLVEFQEFRIRAAVANLGVKGDDGARRDLTDDEYDTVVNQLLTWGGPGNPRWLDVAAWIDISIRRLVKPSIDDGGLSTAPFDRTSEKVLAKFAKKTQVGAWWPTASAADRADLIALVADSTTSSDDVSERLADFASEWSDETLEALDALQLENGRAAYSRESLLRLNAVMAEHRCGEHEARKIAFGVDDNWRPAPPKLEDPIEHPTVQRVNALVRRFLMTATAKWGPPETVVVEHVRSAFLGPTGLAEHNSEIARNTRKVEKTKEELTAQGVERPSRRDVRRHEAIARQNSTCLYCGTSIGLSTCELDHIVADALGGSNRRDNLVAVCKACNGAKGKLPFKVFASRSNREEVSVDEARLRLRAWQKDSSFTNKAWSRFIQDVARRLGLEESDDENAPDDRSIESTAYAAREMHKRIQHFLDSHTLADGISRGVQVYSGSVTSEARLAGEIHDRLQLRGKSVKSRFDRRHHAIDAAVLTVVTPGVAVTLRERSLQHRANSYSQKTPEWKDYRGANDAARVSFARFQKHAKALANLLWETAEQDRIAVAYPLRLSPRVGSVHKDTVQKLVRRSLNDPLSAEDISRVADDRLFRLLAELAKDHDGALPADPDRARELGRRRDDIVELFPSNSGWIKVRGGCAGIGDSIQHAQVYAWPHKEGFKYGIVRIYSAELPKLGIDWTSTDYLTHSFPMHSQTMRAAHPTVLAKLISGDARQIGWISIDDEIEINVNELRRSGDSGKLSSFLGALPESRWCVAGLMSNREVSIRPFVLASEGLPGDAPEIVKKVVTDGRIPISPTTLMGSRDCKIIRRSILGTPRWRGDGLPASWAIRERAEQVFGS